MRIKFLWIVLCIGLSQFVHADTYGDFLYPQKRKSIDEFISQERLQLNRDSKRLHRLFSYVRINQSLFPQVLKPVETVLRWENYRSKFLTNERITIASQFCLDYQTTLAEIELFYQVDASMICAIIAIETYMGRNTGKYPVFITLANLAFMGVSRQDFFKNELRALFTLTETEQLELLSLHGSYAGAMGLPQFISSSYLRIAIDYDCDGKRDLWQSIPDVVGSVGYYFKLSGWKLGAPILTRVTDYDDLEQFALAKERDVVKVKTSDLLKAGVTLQEYEEQLQTDRTVGIFYILNEAGEKQYYVGFQNFLTILKYNGATFYAMVAHELSNKIKEEIKVLTYEER
ncbi:MAG: lytic murein transglycosylase [Methylacidiphilales bacterium]|nr:lytic murein transglycosylase [Candidatus Methylacidiphilales bacterium]